MVPKHRTTVDTTTPVMTPLADISNSPRANRSFNAVQMPSPASKKIVTLPSDLMVQGHYLPTPDKTVELPSSLVNSAPTLGLSTKKTAVVEAHSAPIASSPQSREVDTITKKPNDENASVNFGKTLDPVVTYTVR